MLKLYGPVNNEAMSSRSVNSGRCLQGYPKQNQQTVKDKQEADTQLLLEYTTTEVPPCLGMVSNKLVGCGGGGGEWEGNLSTQSVVSSSFITNDYFPKLIKESFRPTIFLNLNTKSP